MQFTFMLLREKDFSPRVENISDLVRIIKNLVMFKTSLDKLLSECECYTEEMDKKEKAYVAVLPRLILLYRPIKYV